MFLQGAPQLQIIHITAVYSILEKMIMGYEGYITWNIVLSKYIHVQNLSQYISELLNTWHSNYITIHNLLVSERYGMYFLSTNCKYIMLYWTTL